MNNATHNPHSQTKVQTPNALNGNVVVTARRMNEDVIGVQKSLRLFLPSAVSNRNELNLQKKSVSLPLNSPTFKTKVDLCDSKSGSSTFQILSGNDDNLFSLEPSQQALILVKAPPESIEANVVVRNGDLNVCNIKVNFVATAKDSDVSLHSKVFALNEISTSVQENSPRGTLVLDTPVINLNQGLVL